MGRKCGEEGDLLGLFRKMIYGGLMDIWEYQRMMANGQHRESDSYWAKKAEEYRRKEVIMNYEISKDFILDWFGEKIFNEIENGRRLRKAA